MTLISYAQNFEDVILWRALKHVERGFYIDIGAQDPVIDSVSLAFYERGWRGVHVEPNSDYADKLRKARPKEEVIQFAINRKAGEIAFYEVADTGLSTGEEEIALRHQAEGFAVKRVTTPCRPLSIILDAYKDREIHWLKIDVEGMEDQVIESWPPSRGRPWIVVVESTKPNSPEQNYMPWEPKLLKLGYDFVYFDGLNRFYVSVEHPELKDAFGPGPNFFDGFVLSGTASAPFCQKVNADAARQLAAEQGARAASEAEARNARIALEANLAELQASLAELRSAKTLLEGHLTDAQRARAALETRLSAIHASASWQITRPLRFASRIVRWLSQGTWAYVTLKPGARPRRVARRKMATLAYAIRTNPLLEKIARRILHHLPAGIKSKLWLMASHAPPLVADSPPLRIADLSPRAREIHAMLKVATETHGKAG